MGIYFVVALRNLVQARRRTLLLGGALSAVAALLVLLLALAQGLTDNMVHYATTLASGHVNIGGFYKLSPGDAAPFVHETGRLRQLVRKEVPEARLVIDRIRGWAKLVSETGGIWTSPTGIDPAEEAALLATFQLAPERAYRKGGGDERPGDLSRVGQPGNILLFASQAKRLEVGIGDPITVVAETESGVTNSSEFTVVAIVEDMGMMSSWMTVVPKQALRDLYRISDDTTGAIMLYLEDISQTEAVLARLQKLLPERGFPVLEHKAEPFWQKLEQVPNEDWTGFRIDLTTWEDESSFLKWVITAFNGVAFFLVGVLLFIIVVGIMNTMFMSVRERTGEVGTLRAIGMGRWRVLAMFLTEAMLLGLSASTLGALVGAGIAWAVDAAQIAVASDAARMILLSDTVHLSVETGQIANAIGIFTVVTAVSALFPAWRAAKMRPVTAIQHVS